MKIVRTAVARACVVVVVAAGLAGLAARPSEATDATCTTKARWTVTRPAPDTPWHPMPRSMTVTHGGYAALIGKVSARCTGNTDPVQGIIWADQPRIQVSRDRGRSWRTIYRNHQVWWEGRGIIKRSGWFRIHYPGGTSYANDRWYGSTSPAVKVGVRRRAAVHAGNAGRGVDLRVRITPASSIRGMHVRYQVERAGRWQLYRRAPVSRRGVAVAHFPRAQLGRSVRVVLPSGRGMVRSVVGPRVVRRH